jgi:hypothetical protein
MGSLPKTKKLMKGEKMRNIVVVIDEILKLIPEDFDEDFIIGLKEIQDSALYTAPEAMSIRWQTGAELFDDYFGNNINELNEWQKQVVKIWMNKN